MQLQYGRNLYPKSYSRKEISQNGAEKDQGSKRIEDANGGQEHREFPWICKLLSTLYPELQPHNKTVKSIKRQKGIGIGQRTSKSI